MTVFSRMKRVEETVAAGLDFNINNLLSGGFFNPFLEEFYELLNKMVWNSELLSALRTLIDAALSHPKIVRNKHFPHPDVHSCYDSEYPICNEILGR